MLNPTPIKLRAFASLLNLQADEDFFEPATFDPNAVSVTEDGIATVALQSVPLIPETVQVIARYSTNDYASVVFNNIKYDTIQDVQDAHFNLYGLEEDELESVRDDVSRPMQERSHATLMFARDSFVINRCSCCGFYYDNMSYGIVCPHCDHRHTKDFPVTRVDEYGRIVS